MIAFDKDHFYITLMNIIEYPPLYSNIYEEYEIYYINRDFQNGIGNRTLFYHFQLLFDNLLKSSNNQNKISTHLSKHELHNIYPDLDENEINKIFNAVNIKSKNIDIYEFINFILTKCSNKQLDMIMRSLTQKSEYLPQPESQLELEDLIEPKIDHQLFDVPEPEIEIQLEEDFTEPEIESQFELDNINISESEALSDIHIETESQEESSYEQKYNHHNKPSDILQTLIQYITNFFKNKFENLKKLFEFY